VTPNTGARLRVRRPRRQPHRRWAAVAAPAASERKARLIRPPRGSRQAAAFPDPRDTRVALLAGLATHIPPPERLAGYCRNMQHWQAIPVAIGGVVVVGFLDEDRIIVGSHSGVGVFDVHTGARIQRTHDENYNWYQGDPTGLQNRGLGRVPSAGILTGRRCLRIRDIASRLSGDPAKHKGTATASGTSIGAVRTELTAHPVPSGRVSARQETGSR
jgi:hypothetical protein